MTSIAVMSFMAGNVAVLSPCVLPAVPFIVSSALNEHKLGPVAIALGLLTSFTAIGVSIAMFGSFLGLDQNLIRAISAWMMAIVGLTFLSSRLQEVLNLGFNRLANKANRTLSTRSLSGLSGQYLIGLMVGAVWSPCIGPTLGSAIALSGQSETQLQGSSLILIYGLGIIIPFLVIAYGTRKLSNNKLGIMKLAQRGKYLLGTLMITFGASVLTGMDKIFEGLIFELMPASLLNFITSM